MPIKNGLCLAFILFLSSISSYATEPPPSPTDFLNKGGLIDPLCIYEIDAHHTTSLKKCGIKTKKGREIIGYNKQLINDGYIGFNYTQSTRHYYSYYKILGKTGNSYVVYTLNSDGNNGQFSSLDLIKRNGDTLHIQKINNEIFEIKQEDQKIIYSTYVNKDSLPDHCPTLGTFERDLTHDFENEKLVYINVDPLKKSDQPCFNNQALEAQKPLSAKELKVFAQQFAPKITPPFIGY